MKTRELKELKLTKNIIIPFPNFQQNTIISPTQMNDNFEEIEYAYNNLIDNHNGALEKINKVLSDLTSSDNEAIVNEQERIEAEEIRVNNEEERIANEEERKTEETKRIAMYNVHLNDEIRREQKHIQMVGEFDTKVGEVDTLISTKTEEYNSFIETKTEEYNTFVETKEVEIQNAINSIPPKSELIGEKGDKGDKGEKGDKGDRGEQGLQGIQGIQGLQGVKGDKGDKGEQGIQGLKGEKGDKGEQGIQGLKGETGVTPNLTVGSVVTLDPYQEATVEIAGTTENPILNFGIPKGKTGGFDLVETQIQDGLLNITQDKYQYADIVDNTRIMLPRVTDFTEIHLFFITTSALTLTFPNIKWQTIPNIEANKTYEFIFTYMNNTWLGGYLKYE